MGRNTRTFTNNYTITMKNFWKGLLPLDMDSNLNFKVINTSFMIWIRIYPLPGYSVDGFYLTYVVSLRCRSSRGQYSLQYKLQEWRASSVQYGTEIAARHEDSCVPGPTSSKLHAKQRVKKYTLFPSLTFGASVRECNRSLTMNCH